MMNLLPVPTIIKWVAVLYAILVVVTLVVLRLGGHELDMMGSVKLALSGALALQALILTVVSMGWRWLWRTVPALGKRLFPDLNGQWQMTIHWQRNGETGQATAKATVKQDLLRISIDVEAPDSDSQTLSVLPKQDPESGRPMLHYIYLVTPHAIGPSPSSPYNGAAILKIGHDQTFSGNYWTSSPSTGRFVLTRAS
jgi:hypothetical protein